MHEFLELIEQIDSQQLTEQIFSTFTKELTDESFIQETLYEEKN